MNMLRESRPILRRFIITITVLAAIFAGLRTVHWAAIRYVTSLGPQPAFPEIRLQKGTLRSEVLEKLGPPEAQLHEAPIAGQPVAETIRYVRGQHALELVFIDGTLESWAETQPINFDKLKHARTFAPDCCGPTGARPADQLELSASESD
ncbi:MAG: hypothetical protein ACYC6N_28125 [Pirellulaceae bacterium]